LATTGIPRSFNVTQGDGKVFLQWDNLSGAISYQIQRSLDNVTFANLATSAVNSYLDTSVTIGVNYFYKVAGINGSGTGIFTNAQNAIPTMGSEMSLQQLGIACRQRADRLNSNFVTLPEINSYINQSMTELYDLLITTYEDYFKAPNAIFYSAGGNQQQYPLPNGITQFYQNDGTTLFTPKPIYKLLGLDLGLNVSNNGWVTVDKFNFIGRNRYFYPNTSSTIYGVFNCQYRWMGNSLELIPTPSASQPFRIHYIPKLPVLLQPNDITDISISGWLEYVITDVAMKILQKEESDVSILAAQKLFLKSRIEESAPNKDAGRPDTISDSRRDSSGGSGYGGGFHGGI
jgi:hypothetical protein